MENIYERFRVYVSEVRDHLREPVFDSRPDDDLDIGSLEELKRAEVNGDIEATGYGRYDGISVDEMIERRRRVEEALGLEHEPFKTLENIE